MSRKNKILAIPYVPQLDGILMPTISQEIENTGTIARVESVNWKQQFPYMPLTTFAIARTDNMLFIKFMVKGSMLKAVYSKDLDPVCKDSCVGFFCKVPNSETYMTFEFNCIGTCKAGIRKSRTEALQYRTPEELSQILRFSSLGSRPFCEMEGMFEWELLIGIPFALLGISSECMPEKLLGNFYKCADDTDSKHYVSWSEIKTEKPDFHCPEYFGDLLFE